VEVIGIEFECGTVASRLGGRWFFPAVSGDDLMSPRKFDVLLLTAALVAALVAGAQADDRDREIRVLVITGGHDYDEPKFHAMFEALPGIGATHRTYPGIAADLTPELADRFDVLVFYDMWAQGITPAQRQAFVALLQRGIGLVALHHTLAAHQDWPEYASIIGGKYHVRDREVDGVIVPHSTYDHDQMIQVRIATQEHPITRGLSDFQIRDETYAGYDKDPRATVLLKTSHPKSDEDLAWAKTYGNSRVVYIQLGHDHFAYQHPTYRTLVARSIRWTAGRVVDPEALARPLSNRQDSSTIDGDRE
jgi:uncharacterized protein